MPDRKSDLYMNVLGDRRSSNNYKRESNVSGGMFSRMSRESMEEKGEEGLMEEGIRQVRYSGQKLMH